MSHSHPYRIIGSLFVALSGISESLALQLSSPPSVTLGANIAVTWTRDSPNDPTSFNLEARSTSPNGPIGPPDPITTGADTSGTVVLVFHQTGYEIHNLSLFSA
jgi:hypothetical protein